MLLLSRIQGQDVDFNVMNTSADEDCNNGSIEIIINSGMSPFTYVWTSDDGTGPTTLSNEQNITQLVGNYTYCVTITDALCREAIQCIELECDEDECSGCSIEGEIRNSSCTRKGRIEVDINCDNNEGRWPWTYQWQDGPNWKSRTDLNPGTYCLVAIDALGCQFERCFDVLGEEELRVEVVNKKNLRQCGDVLGGVNCNGAIDIQVVSGGNNYVFSWSNGSSSQNISGLCEGNYTVTVTDGNGCETTLEVNICCCNELVQEGLEVWEVFQYPGTCYSDGEYSSIIIEGETHSGAFYPYISTDVSGGTGDLICNWQGPNGFSAYDCWGLSGPLDIGTYCLTVDDGCSEVTECFDIVDCSLSPINISEMTEPACPGYNVGSINVAISGGTAPFRYNWSTGGNTPSISNLPSGLYSVTVTDNNGCTNSKEISISSQSTSEDRCLTLCGSQVVVNDGPETFVTDPFDCDYVDLVCSNSGEVLTDNIFVGTNLSFDQTLCKLSLVNALTGEECPGSAQFGTQCSSCLFGAVDDTGTILINCTVQSCYFPSLNATIVTGIDDFNNIIVSVTIDPENNGCFLQIFDNCTDPNNPIVDGTIPCDDNPFQQISCAAVVPTFQILDGNPFGCDFFKEDSTEDSFSKMRTDYGDFLEIAQLYKGNFKILESSMNEFIANVSPNPFSSNISLKIESENAGLTKLQIYNLNGEKVKDLNLYIQDGVNKYELDLGELSDGAYILHISNKNETLYTQRIIKSQH